MHTLAPLEEQYRKSRAHYLRKLEETRHLPEMDAYVRDRVALIQSYMQEYYPQVPCQVEPLVQEYSRPGDLGVNLEIQFTLCYARHIDMFTQLAVTCALNDYLDYVDHEPYTVSVTLALSKEECAIVEEPLHLIPQWCLSRQEG
jgi:hypothetical protein